MRGGTPADLERRPSLFPDDQEGEHDVFQKRERGLVNRQRKLLRIGLCDELVVAFLVQLRKQISLWIISNSDARTESPHLKSVILRLPHVLLLVRPYKRTGPTGERSVDVLGAKYKVTHSPNATRSGCKNIFKGIALLPILTTEGRVLCQSTCAMVLSSPASELEEDDAL
jgi:hypothetical protein